MKRKTTKLLSLFLAIVFIVTLLPSFALAEGEPVYVAQIGGKSYTSLATAITEANDGAAINLLADTEISTPINITKNLSITGDPTTNPTITATGLKLFNVNKDGVVFSLLNVKMTCGEADTDNTQNYFVQCGTKTVELNIQNCEFTNNYYGFAGYKIFGSVTGCTFNGIFKNYIGGLADNGALEISNNTFNAMGTVNPAIGSSAMQRSGSALDIDAGASSNGNSLHFGSSGSIVISGNTFLNNGSTAANAADGNTTGAIKAKQRGLERDSGYTAGGGFTLALTVTNNKFYNNSRDIVLGTSNIDVTHPNTFEMSGNTAYSDAGLTAAVPVTLYDFSTNNTSKQTDSVVTTKIFTNTVAVNGVAKYATLAEAVEAAESGDTIKLLKDSTGKGIRINTAEAKALTIDFDGHTYTVNELVGDVVNQAFHLQKGCTITMKNGTIAFADAVEESAKFFVQNYCDLTLENITVDGTDLTNIKYMFSNNNGDITIKNCNVTAPAGCVAIDAAIWGSYNGAEVTIDGGTIIGDLEVAEWKYDSDTKKWVKQDGYTLNNGRPVLTVKGGTFTDLADAVLCAEPGAVIKLANDVVIDKQIVVDKALTLDLNGKTVSNTTDIWNDAVGVKTWSLISVQAGGALTLKGNGTLDAKDNDCYAVDVRGGGSCVIEDGTYVGNISAVYVEVGSLTVNGGDFSIVQKSTSNDERFTLNCYDDNFENGSASIVVTGGSFKNFDPGNNLAEDPIGSSFLAEGKTTAKVGDRYIVGAESVNNAKIEEVAAVVAQVSPAPEVVATAVETIAAVPNEALTDAAALDTLAVLEEKYLANEKISDTVVTATVPATITEVKVDNAALSVPSDVAAPTAAKVAVTTVAEPTTLADDLAVLGVKAAAGATIIPLEIKLTVGDSAEAIHTPAAPLVFKLKVNMTAEKAEKLMIVHYKNETTKELIVPTVTTDDNGVYLNFTATSLSTFVAVETANNNKYLVEFVPDKTIVSGNDLVTFTVKVKQTVGTDPIGYLNLFFNDVAEQFEFVSVGGTYGLIPQDREGIPQTDFEFRISSGAGVAVPADGLVLGTVTMRAKAGLANGAVLGDYVTLYTTDDASGITNGTGETAVEAGFEVSMTDVTYRNLTVSFDFGKGADATVAYAKYNDATGKLYTDNTYAAEFTVPVPTQDDAAGYRLIDANWHLGYGAGIVGTPAQAYTANAAFYSNVVPEYAITSPSAVVLGSGARQVGEVYYAAKGIDLEFTVTAGSYTPVVSYSIGVATAVDMEAEEGGGYKIDGSAITDAVSINVTLLVSAESVKTFVTGADESAAWTPYSPAFAAGKTLVLLKLANLGDSQCYTIDGGPTLYKLPANTYKYGEIDYNYAALIPTAGLTSVAKTDAGMKSYMETRLRIVDGTQVAIEYNWNANGLSGARVADVQAVYNFVSRNVITWGPTDNLLLLADVMTYDVGYTDRNTARDGQLTTADIDAFLYAYAFFPTPAIT